MAQQISPAAFVDQQPQPIKAICKTLRALSRKNMPGAIEMVYHNALGYSLTDSAWDRICYIQPQRKGYVNFGFFFGGPLHDPEGLLIGDSKRMRHIKIYAASEAKNPAIKKLVEEAWANAEKDIAGWRQSLRRKK
jgi:hypothetical protein